MNPIGTFTLDGVSLPVFAFNVSSSSGTGPVDLVPESAVQAAGNSPQKRVAILNAFFSAPSDATVRVLSRAGVVSNQVSQDIPVAARGGAVLPAGSAPWYVSEYGQTLAIDAPGADVGVSGSYVILP